MTNTWKDGERCGIVYVRFRPTRYVYRFGTIIEGARKWTVDPQGGDPIMPFVTVAWDDGCVDCTSYYGLVRMDAVMPSFGYPKAHYMQETAHPYWMKDRDRLNADWAAVQGDIDRTMADLDIMHEELQAEEPWGDPFEFRWSELSFLGKLLIGGAAGAVAGWIVFAVMGIGH